MQRLEPRLQQALLGLTLFERPFTANAARQVAHVSLVELLELVEHSLLLSEEGRLYSCHPLVRSFVRMRQAHVTADAAMEATWHDVLDRHAAHFIEHLARHAAKLHGRTPLTAAHTIWLVWEDIQRAWKTAVATHRTDLIARGHAGLAEYCVLNNRRDLGASMLRPAIAMVEQAALPPDARDELHASLLIHLSWLAFEDGPTREIEDNIARALVLALRIEDSRLMALAYRFAAYLPLFGGDEEKALSLLGTALECADQAGATRARGLILRQMALSVRDTDYIDRLEQAILQFRKCGDITSESELLSLVGAEVAENGRYQQASSYMERAVWLCATQELDATTINTVRANQARFHLAFGQHELALSLFHQVLDYFLRARLERLVINAHEQIGLIHLRRNRPHVALDHAEKAYLIAQEQSLQPQGVSAHPLQVEALTVLGLWDQAERMCAPLLVDRSPTESDFRTQKSWSAWLNLHLAQGKAAEVANIARQMLTHLEPNDELETIYARLPVYAVALEVTFEAENGRFRPMLAQVINLLTAIAAEIAAVAPQDVGLWHAFWHAIPQHQRLARLWLRLTGTDATAIRAASVDN